MALSDMDDDRAQATAYVDQAIAMPIQQFAFNAAVSTTSPTEIMTVIGIGNRPLGLLIMSPVMAKTLALSLLSRVQEYEELTDTIVKSVAEIKSLKQTAHPI